MITSLSEPTTFLAEYPEHNVEVEGGFYWIFINESGSHIALDEINARAVALHILDICRERGW